MENYALNPHYKLDVIHIESIGEDIIIIDNFLKSIEPVIHFANHFAYLEPIGSDGTLFPGKRDTMPKPYYRVFEQLFATLNDKGVFKGKQNLYLHRCKLSLVTQKSGDLNILQRIPHIDSTDDNTYAAVHYIKGKESNGTAIYRYKPKNLVKITDENQHAFLELIEETKKHESQHCGYLNSDTSLFEQVVSIEAKENRIVLYKSNLLHCASLDNNVDYTADIRHGRLSISSFFRLIE